MVDAYKKVVEQIFNNWSALQLAVEHSMGGASSKQVAIECVDYIANYCVNESGIEIEDIEDVLEDIMDQEFNTICEDNSIKEVSNLLYRFLQLLKEGNKTQFDVEFNNLPSGKKWLSEEQQHETVHCEKVVPGDSASLSTSSTTDVDMGEDPGWTKVHSKKRK